MARDSADTVGRDGVQMGSLVEEEGAFLPSALLSGGVSGGVGNPLTAKDAEGAEQSSLVVLLWGGFLSWTCCFC